jgi:hypothetical protein
MLEDKSKKVKFDGARINVNDPCELADWTEKLGYTADKIRHAVATVGNLAKDVHKALAK